MSAINPFHSREVDESEQRPASDVFRSSVASSESAINSRFASSGKFTTEQLEAGDDVGTPSNEPEFDPDDKRSLYERLQAQRDAKQEEFEHRNTFKNQMDHWRLDEDDAAFEDERRQRQLAQQQESARLHQEGAEFYRLARATQERVVMPDVSIATATPSVWEERARALKRKPPSKPTAALKVIKTHPSSAINSVGGSSIAGAAVGGEASGVNQHSTPRPSSEISTTKPGVPCCLPGMGDYGSDDDEDEED